MSNGSIEHQYYANACVQTVCPNCGSKVFELDSIFSQSNEEQKRKFFLRIKEALFGEFTINLYLDLLVGTICKSDSYFIVTQRRVHSLEYKWTIKDFTSTVQNCPGKFYILSDKFSPSNETRYAFGLVLFSNKQEEHKDYISLNVFFVSKEIEEITARFRVSILDTNGNKWTRWDKKMSISKGGKFSIPKLFPHSYLKTPLMIEEYLPNDRLTLLCEVWVEDDKIEELKTEYNLLRPATIPSIQMNNVSVNGSHFLMNSTSQIGGNAEMKNSLINENSVDKN